MLPLVPKKTRIPIPTSVAAQLLFEADRTCCVCRVRHKAVQIHHLDDDPSNNDPANLAALCLECHRETQIEGGFGRKLDAAQIALYRDDWSRTVASRRDEITASLEAREDAEVSEQLGLHMHLSDLIGGVAKLLPEWLDVVEIDPVVVAQFKATQAAYGKKIDRARSGGPRFALELRRATELLTISEKHASLVDMYATRTSELDPLVEDCLQQLQRHPEIWPLLAELDGAIQVATEIIRYDQSFEGTGIHVLEYATKHIHESPVMEKLVFLWRHVRRTTSEANDIVMEWDVRLTPFRAGLESADAAP
jgi:hypothetical protein